MYQASPAVHRQSGSSKKGGIIDGTNYVTRKLTVKITLFASENLIRNFREEYLIVTMLNSHTQNLKKD